MTVQITPLHDRVLVRRLEEKEAAEGGIIIPDTAKEKSQEGEVMAVGGGKIDKGKRVPLDVDRRPRRNMGRHRWVSDVVEMESEQVRLCEVNPGAPGPW
jgi:chaperonin GroES